MTASLRVTAPDGKQWLVEESLIGLYVDDEHKICNLKSEIQNHNRGAMVMASSRFEVEVTLRWSFVPTNVTINRTTHHRAFATPTRARNSRSISMACVFAKGALIPTDSFPTHTGQCQRITQERR
jgi:hypothetical protein